MLVLTRKVNEKIIIDGNIEITIIKNERNQVSIGIQAPRHIPIVRAELLGDPNDKNLPPKT